MWERFVAAFPARRGCIGEVRLDTAWELGDRATYDPATRTVVLRVPGTAPNLSASLVHEWGHHLEFACRSQEDVREEFLRAEGLPGPWDADVDWFDAPAEHWAEAVVEHVLGSRGFHRGRVPVTREAVGIVADWAEGEALTHR